MEALVDLGGRPRPIFFGCTVWQSRAGLELKLELKSKLKPLELELELGLGSKLGSKSRLRPVGGASYGPGRNPYIKILALYIQVQE